MEALSTNNDGNGNGNGPLLATLSRLGRDRHPQSDTKAVTAPEEPDRVPMLQQLRDELGSEEAGGAGDARGGCGGAVGGERQQEAHPAEAGCPRF